MHTVVSLFVFKINGISRDNLFTENAVQGVSVELSQAWNSLTKLAN